MSYVQKNELAFTLVELAIVLVVIGLLVGGVLLGQELIEQATTRAQINQLRSFEEARNTFISKFGQNPGDFSKAAQFFSNVSGGGNGDGRVDEFDWPYTITDILTMTTYMPNQETLHFWEHLSLAGMIKDNLNGIVPGLNNVTSAGDIRQAKTAVGDNIPKGKIRSSCVDIEYNGYPFVTPGVQAAVEPRPNFGGYYDYYMLAKVGDLGGVQESCAFSLFTPEEAFLFDQKIDDGIANSGAVSGLDSRAEYNGDEAPSNCVSSDLYDFTITNKSCVVAYGFIK